MRRLRYLYPALALVRVRGHVPGDISFGIRAFFDSLVSIAFADFLEVQAKVQDRLLFVSWVEFYQAGLAPSAHRRGGLEFPQHAVFDRYDLSDQT